MSWFSYIFPATLIISSIILVVVALYAYQKRENPGGLFLSLLLFALAEWSLAAFFEAIVTTIPDKVLWSKISYLGVVNSPLLVTLFTLEFTRGKKLEKIWFFSPLLLLQLFFLGLAFTNEHHHLIWTTFTPIPIPGFNIIKYGHGAWFWIMIAYIYLLLVLASILLGLAFFRSRHIHQKQIFVSIIALLPPFLVNILYVFEFNPFVGWDITPAAFAMTGLLLAWSFFRLDYLDLAPIARDQVIEEMVDGLLILDSSNRIIDINPAAQKLISVDARSVVGRNADIVLGDLLQDHRRLLSAPETSAEIYIENIGYLEWRASPLHTTGGIKFPGRLVTLRDITDRKRTEEALTRLNASLEEQVLARTAEIRKEKELSEAILQSVSDGIVMTSPDFRILYVNTAFIALSGFRADQVLGLHAIKVILGESAGWVRQSIELHLNEGSLWQNEVVACRKDGRTFDASLTIAPIKDGSQKISGHVFTLRDVSQRKNLDRVRYKFMENISHQFRTPVTVLNLYAQLMGHGDLSTENQRHLDTIKNQIERLTHLIQDIIEMANLDIGKVVSVWSDIHLLDMIKATVSNFTNRAGKAGIKLEINPLPIDAPVVRGDEKRLVQALGEVLENAIVFTPSGGEIRIDLSIVKTEENWAAISVIDSGPGIPDDEHEKIFERFFRGRLADSGHTVGSGLGLSIAQEIMLAHGGHITFDSGSNGSTFRLWLPVN